MNAIYEGISTGTVNNGVAEIISVRVPEHACRCEECKALDEIDAREISLCKRYLSTELSYEQFRLEHVQAYSILPSALASLQRHYDTGALSLADAVEGLMEDFSDWGGLIQMKSVNADCLAEMTESEFRYRLDGLVYGYELRMRTVHKWTKGAA